MCISLDGVYIVPLYVTHIMLQMFLLLYRNIYHSQRSIFRKQMSTKHDRQIFLPTQFGLHRKRTLLVTKSKQGGVPQTHIALHLNFVLLRPDYWSKLVCVGKLVKCSEYAIQTLPEFRNYMSRNFRLKEFLKI